MIPFGFRSKIADPSPRKAGVVCLAILAWVAGTTAAGGCSSSGGDFPELGSGGGDASSGAPGGFQVGGDTSDGGSADSGARSELGNLLCHASPWGCYPDGNKAACVIDGGTPFIVTPNQTTSTDSGTYGASPTACRVRDSNGSPKATCVSAGTGQNDAPCTGANACASGYECIGVPGRCRHYCCDGPSACATDHFCDFQSPVEQQDVSVPVCMPVRECTLLKQPSTDCQVGETCAIVEADYNGDGVVDEGVTSCEAIGPGQVGDGCETAHCGRDLVCLGQTGSRTCYRLCEKTGNANTCNADEKCKGSAPIFKDPNIGYCAKSNL